MSLAISVAMMINGYFATSAQSNKINNGTKAVAITDHDIITKSETLLLAYHAIKIHARQKSHLTGGFLSSNKLIRLVF